MWKSMLIVPAAAALLVGAVMADVTFLPKAPTPVDAAGPQWESANELRGPTLPAAAPQPAQWVTLQRQDGFGELATEVIALSNPFKNTGLNTDRPR
jgi:hypothetical protein